MESAPHGEPDPFESLEAYARDTEEVDPVAEREPEPVVESEDEKWVVGMLKRRDVIGAYNREIIRRGISQKSASIQLT